ncbi:male sterility protein-domain-containing protein [Mycena rebaudengoi]|nr:male sterility protein-domain-containing protein [Mycena rebaudengoi]
MPASEPLASPSTFFSRQTIFLTGGTGSLGGCLLFKLATKLDALKIYVLVRGSPAKAMARWAETMPTQFGQIFATKKVQLVVGDVTKKNCGLDPKSLSEIVNSVTVVIHSAGNINMRNPLKTCTIDNCMGTLELAQLASSFTSLIRFVHVSTAYANPFLPDGVVKEKIYEVGGNTETLLAEILETGSITSKSLPNFGINYFLSKHLAERLLLSRNPSLPVLIIRPTIIGPAISEPYPYYGPDGACPMSTYTRAYMVAPDSGVFHVSPQHPTGSNVLDEIPVDLVANLLLLHVMHGTTGIVQAGAESYVRRSLSQLHDTIRAQMPSSVGGPAAQFSYVSDAKTEMGRYAKLWAVLGRDWHFSNSASKALAGVGGPLSIAVPKDHDAAKFMSDRAKLIAEDLVRTRSRSKSRL